MIDLFVNEDRPVELEVMEVIQQGSGVKDVWTGEHTIATDTNDKFTLTHNCGVVPDIFIFYAKSDPARAYTCLSAIYFDKTAYSPGFNNTNLVRNSSNTLTSYYRSNNCISDLTETSVTIARYNSASFYWRAGTYGWIAVKLND